jgi:glucose/mannose-6-phosphate isomerase
MIEAVYYAKKLKVRKRQIDKIVACGMGGSGIGSAILRNLLKDELKVPFETFNSYTLPEYVDSKTLVFCVSFSGNTEETIACYKQAKKRGAYAVSVTTGGWFKKNVKKDIVIVPARAPQPRMGLAYVCLPQLIVLEELGLVEKKNAELGEAVFLLKKEQHNLEEKAKELALKMKGKLPIIYAPEELERVAYRFRTDINENSKQYALHNFLPEHNHNSINAWLGLGKKDCEFFFLRHGGESKKIATRFKVTKKVVGKHFNVTEVHLKGKSLIAVTFYALQLAALTSYYLSLLNKLDPEPIPMIALLKKELKK